MILIEPQRQSGFISGGYRYNARVFEHLAPEHGRKVAATPAELPAVVARIRRDEPGTCIIVDGLFAELGPKPLPAEAVTLLHMVPSRTDWWEEPPRVIATSAATASAIAGVSRSTAVVPPGLDQCFDLERLPAKQGDAPKVVCVGTISPGKDQVRLVRLLESIPEPWRLTLIGSFDPASEAVAGLRRCGERLPVALTGPKPIEAVAECFASSDLLISLSRSESFGMAVAEAAAAGLPVLALATGEIDRFVVDGSNGWLLPPDAEDQAIRSRLQDLLAKPAKLEAAKAARSRPAMASWQEVAHSFSQACAVSGDRQ